MSGIYNNILNVQDMHFYYNGNIRISTTALWIICKPKKNYQWSKRSVYLNGEWLNILKT